MEESKTKVDNTKPKLREIEDSLQAIGKEKRNFGNFTVPSSFLKK